MVILLLVACLLLFSLVALVALVLMRVARVAAAVQTEYTRTRAEFDEIRDGFVTLFTEPEEGKPSPFAIQLDLVAQQIASRLEQSMMAAFNGVASGAARGMKSIEGDIAQAQLAQNGSPLAQIAGMLLQKQIKKNPMLAMALSQIKLPGGGASAPGNNHHAEQSSFGFKQ